MYKRIATILIFGTLTACEIQESSLIIGSWCQCLRDGAYKEFKISKHYTTTLASDLLDHDYEDSISFYECYLQDSLLIVTKGINVSLLNAPETLRFESISHNKIALENQFGILQLTRLKKEIPDIDSANLELWSKSYLDEFIKRAELANCPDLRTEEEKKPLEDLGVVDDDFEDLIDIDKLPEWAETRYSKYVQNFERAYKLFPNFYEEDFTGDGSADIAIFVSEKSAGKKGILFFLGDDEDLIFLAGAGSSFGAGGDNFEWADSWKVFNQQSTQETTFLENGDIDGTREVKLDNVAISIREDEGSGGLIYYNGEKFIWIHQGD